MNSIVTGMVAVVDDVKKKYIVVFTYKQSLLSVDMKTKLVQHVESESVKVRE